MMLSRLLGLRLVCEGASRGQLADLVVDLQSGDEPRVTHLVAQARGAGQCVMPWESISQLDLDAESVVLSKRPEESQSGRPDELPGDSIRLRHDILDAAIIDIADRQTLVANDLWLERQNEDLRLAAVDTSAWGIVRRLSRGLIDRRPKSGLRPWATVDYLRGVPHGPDESGQHSRLARLPRGEIALLLETLSYLHATELVAQLDDQQAAGVLQAMSPERQLQVFEEIDQQQAVRLLEFMAPDDAADLVGELQPQRVREYIKALPEVRRNQLLALLGYPLDSAGGIMTNDLIVFPRNLTVGEAREQLRGLGPTPELIYFIYVVDDLEHCRLCGVVTLRELVRAEDDEPLEELMSTHLVTIDPGDPAQAAAQRVVDNQLIALPVVNQDGRLVGAITVDAAVHQVAPTSWRIRAPKVFA